MDSEETKSPFSDKIALLDNLVGIIPSDNLEIVDIREERLSEQSALD